ncbi:MAG: HD domain-containing protein [Planctomycetota bacterium]
MNSACKEVLHRALAVVRPQFRLDLHHGVHGIAHWSRVWRHGRELARSLDVDPRILAWFAFLHDSQRVDEGTDPGHGERAADFAVRLRQDGILTGLSAVAFEQLCEAMRLHSDGHTEGEPAILACWDADRLDLGRVGIRPRPDRLCTALGRSTRTIVYATTLTDLAAARRRPRRRSGFTE